MFCMKQFSVSFFGLFFLLFFSLLPILVASDKNPGGGYSECLDNCSYRDPQKISTGDIEKFIVPLAKADYEESCRPPKAKRVTPLTKYFNEVTMIKICDCIGRDDLAVYSGIMTRVLDKIERDTTYCYKIHDPAIYNSIYCVGGDGAEDTIFSFAAINRRKRMMVEFYKNNKCNINDKDPGGNTIYDYVDKELKAAEARLKRDPQNARLETQVQMWKEYIVFIANMGAMSSADLLQVASLQEGKK